MAFLQVKFLDDHKAVFIFEDSANVTSRFGERVSGVRRPSEDGLLPTSRGRTDLCSKSGEMQLSN